MAKRKRPTPRPTGSTLPPPSPPPNRTPWFIGGGVVLVVVIAAIIAVVASGGGDDDTDATLSRVSTTTAGVTLPIIGPPVESAAPGEYQDVTVTGEALSRLPDGDDPAVGATAPGLQGFSFDGTPVSVTPGDGQPTMVVFLAHWCPHCNREVPRLVGWNDDGRVPAGLRIVGVSTGARDDAPNWPPSEWIADEDWPWPVMADTEEQVAAAAYGLPGYPFFVVIGADGTVLHRQSGEVPIDTLEQVLASVGIQ